MSKRIAIINTLYAPNQIGGAEKSVQTLAENFSLLGNDVLVICLAKKNETYQLNGVTVQAIKIKNDYWPFEADNKSTTKKLLWHIKDASNKKYNPILTKILSDFKPDILFSNNLSGFSTKVWRIAKKLNIKIVHTLRDYYLQCPKSIKFKNNINCIHLCFDCKLLSSPKKTDTLLVDYLIGISNYILNDHIKNGYFKDIPNKTIYNGFDIKNIRYKRARDKKIVFGFMGQINESKGIELLLKSLSKIEFGNWKLRIAGNLEEQYHAKLKSINSSNKIEYLGYITRDTFFEEIDLLIVPSLWHEPFGRVVLESHIYNTPVLASNVGGISELMFTNKNFLFEASESILIQKLEEIISNPKILDDFYFDQEFIEKFSIETSMNKYIEIFKKLINT